MTKKRVIHTDDAPKAIGPYSQAIAAGGVLYCSGQIPLDPVTGKLVGEGDIAAQTQRVMDSLGAVLHAGGATFDNVVKCGIFLADMMDFASMNEVYATYFKDDPPARACVAARTLPRNVLVEVDAIAVLA